MDLGGLSVNTIFYTLGVVVGSIMRRADLAFEWFADGYNAARFYAEPRPVPETRTPLIDLDALKATAGAESHTDGRTGVPGVDVPNR